MRRRRLDVVLIAAGALVFALNIAPTAEPILLAAELDGVRLGLLLVASLVLPYLMVFYADCSPSSCCNPCVTAMLKSRS